MSFKKMKDSLTHFLKTITKISKQIIFVLIIPTVLLLSGCPGVDPSEELDKKINIAIRSGNNIDEFEWNDISNYIINNKEGFPDLIEDDKINTLKLTNYILAFSQNRRGQTEPDIFNPEISDQDSLKPVIKVFIENSLSMDGYVNGNSDFKADLTEMLVLTKNHVGESNISINFINSKAFPSSNKDIVTFASKLEPNSMSYSIGGKGRGKSDINNIFRILLDSLHENNIVILISDCIYSLGDGDETEGKLNIQKSLTHDAFNDALKRKKNDLSTVCLKMISNFNGLYYDLNDKPVRINDQRPYYIWIMGQESLINEYYPKITKNLVGINNSYVLTSKNNGIPPFYTVLRETNGIGTFKIAKEDRGKSTINSIQDITFSKGKFQFALALDLSQILVDKSYLLSSNNYKAEGYEIVSVEPVDQNNLLPNEWKRLESSPATHIITVATSDKTLLRDMELELLNSIPEWVEQSSSNDDRQLTNELNKTFGLSYLVQGIREAYVTQNPKQTSYFKIKVTIKK